MEEHFADVWEAVAAAIPDEPAVVHAGRRLSWADYDGRAARVASVLDAHGIGDGAKVGLYLTNSAAYLEAHFAAFKVRAVPINVNYRYLDDELVYLLDNAEVEALVYHAGFADRVERIRARIPRVRLYLEVDDGTASALDGSLGYEDALAAADPLPPRPRSADDLYILYTGGTTGLPKGVMYRIGDMVGSFLRQTCALFGLEATRDPARCPEIAKALAAAGEHKPTLVAPPLMHGTGMWMGVISPHMMGSPVVLLGGRGFDADELLDAVARDRVRTLIIVGDAFALPILDALDRRPADLSSLQFLTSSGAMLSARSKERLLAAAPHLVIADLLGSSEAGMARSITAKGRQTSTAKFKLNPGARVVDEAGDDAVPGSGAVGTLLVTSDMVPLGYYRDPEKSARTFVERDGVRYVIPGDMATVEPDGSIRLLGRGSACINTGGEKVFPEEVEEAVKTHPAVADCLVFGVDDERLGQRVVGVVNSTCGGSVDAEDLIAHTRSRLAGYKVPRQFAVVGESLRGPNGKADYQRARALFTGAVAS